MTRERQLSSLCRACPQTGDYVANESGAYSSDLALLEIVMPADFKTVTDSVNGECVNA
jgi:hypothetical protein